MTHKDDDLIISHDERAGAFTAEIDGHGLDVEYLRQGERLVFTHTGTHPALRGRGLAGRMVEHALQWAAPQGLQVVPACSYVQAHMQRHRRWQRLLEPAGVQQVLNFWFGVLGSADDGQVRRQWFVKDENFDVEIRSRFGPLIDAALTDGLPDWLPRPLGALAAIVVLDQFTRNTFRGQARAFAGDAQALRIALALLDDGSAAKLNPLERWFALMPLEHAEDLAMQQRCVREFEALAAVDSRMADPLDYARRHLAVIERFGRFPHRNAALGRTSTPEEAAFIAQPGSGF